MHTKESLTDDLIRAGIQPSDTLLVHSSMKSIGAVDGGADTVLDALMDYFREKENITLEWDGPQLRMIPTAHKPIFDRIRDKRLRILSAGVVVGESKGKDLIPSQALALSQELNPSAFPDAELTWEEAIRYLRKEAITLPEGLPKGYLLIRYQDVPLGFVKHLGNRSNNLYPQEWRIRSTYIPDPVSLFE